ncbi:hypothetical protein WMF30_27915 [Sorangium sp. So ce134]
MEHVLFDAVDHGLVDGRHRPAEAVVADGGAGSGAASTSPGALGAAGVEVLRDRSKPFAGGVPPEDLADDLRLLLVDLVLDAYAPVAVLDLDIVVAVDPAADVEPAPGLGQEVLVRPLADLLPLELGGEVTHGEHNLSTAPSILTSSSAK